MSKQISKSEIKEYAMQVSVDQVTAYVTSVCMIDGRQVFVESSTDKLSTQKIRTCISRKRHNLPENKFMQMVRAIVHDCVKYQTRHAFTGWRMYSNQQIE